jgi:hypothetical protein
MAKTYNTSLIFKTTKQEGEPGLDWRASALPDTCVQAEYPGLSKAQRQVFNRMFPIVSSLLVAVVRPSGEFDADHANRVLDQLEKAFADMKGKGDFLAKLTGK